MSVEFPVLSCGTRKWEFHRAELIERPLAEGSAELAAEARLPTPGEAMASDRKLRRMRLGIGVAPAAGVPLDCGIMFVAFFET